MITSQELYELEKKSKLPLEKVMENAGKAVVEEIKKRFDVKNKKIIIFAWHGNNAGDGFVSAYRLANAEAQIKILFLGKEEKMTGLAKSKFERIKHLITEEINKEEVKQADIIVDAILGTGTRGQIKEPLASAIDLFNSSQAFKVAVDVPSGINPDTGEKANKFIQADLIVTMHDMKPGLLEFKDKIVIRKIGLE